MSIRKDYIVLDSKYRELTEFDNTPIKKFKFNYVNTRYLGSGIVNSSSSIKNIISIKLFNICTPYGIEQYDGKLSYIRLSVLISELSGQAYIMSDQMKAHWILKNVENNPLPGKRAEFDIEEFSDGVFYFNDRIRILDNITIIFGSPIYPVSFYYDRDDCTVNSYGVTTEFKTNYPHQFAGNFYISIDGFKTNDMVADKSVIDSINGVELLGTRTGIDTFTIAIDTTTINAIIGLSCKVFFEERRVIMNMEVTYEVVDKK